MIVDDKNAKLIADYSASEFSDWFQIGFAFYYKEKNNIKAFYPLRSYIGIADDIITDLGNIYDSLSPESKIKYKKGLIMAFDDLDSIKENLQIVKDMMYLSGKINAKGIVDSVIKKVGNGYFVAGKKEEQDDDNNNLFAIAFDVVKHLSHSGGEPLRELIASKYFRFQYAPKAFIALCHAEPKSYPEHLRLLRKSFAELHSDYSIQEDAYITANRFIDCVNLKVIADNICKLKINERPDEEPKDNWLLDALFIGDYAPLILQYTEYGDGYCSIARKDSLFVSFQIKNQKNDDEFNEYIYNVIIKNIRRNDKVGIDDGVDKILMSDEKREGQCIRVAS